MAVEAIAEQRLGPADEAAISALLARSFPTDFGGRSYFRQRHHLRLIWREAGEVCAHIAVLYRAIRLGDEVLTIAGLAEVATDEGHRGRGLAGQLLTAAIAEARAAQVPFVLLFGQAGLYAGAGFRPASNPMRYVNLDGMQTRGLRHRKGSGLMVLPLGQSAWDGAAPLDLLGHSF